MTNEDVIKKNSKSLRIAILSCDWRDDFRTAFLDVTNKLERDGLGKDKNQFLFVSWAYDSYQETKDRFSAIHIKLPKKTPKPLYDFLSIFTFPFVVKKSGFKPDVIIVYDFGMACAAWLIKLLCGGIVVEYVTFMPRKSSGTRSFGFFRSLYSSFLEKIGLHFADYFFTLNDTMKKYLLSIGAKEKRIKLYIVNTIERDASLINYSAKGKIRTVHNTSPGTKIILTVARFETEKDYPRLIHLFSHIISEINTVLIIVGVGKLEAEVKRLVADLHIENKVFFDGLVSREKIWDYYQDADVFVMLSKAEALGIVFWEAMHMNVPVIGSDIPNILETIGNDRERGRIMSASETEKEFKEKIMFCLGQSKEKQEMLTRARTFVEEKLKNKAVINDYF